MLDRYGITVYLQSLINAYNKGSKFNLLNKEHKSSIITYALYYNIWGRKGFDGDFEASVASRVARTLKKSQFKIKRK